MTKQQFLAHLRAAFATLPPGECEERLLFYSEMILDRMEEGLSEEEAVSSVCAADAAARAALPCAEGAGEAAPARGAAALPAAGSAPLPTAGPATDEPAPTPPPAPAETSAPKKRRGWVIALLALGAPLWLALLLAAGAVVLAAYASLWAAVISLWAVFAALAASALGCGAAGLGFLIGGHGSAGLFTLGVAALCASLAIFLFFGSRAATRGTVGLVRRLLRRLASKH